MQIGDRAVAANFDASPNHGTDAQDENLELVDGYLLRVRHRAILSHFGSFISPKNNRSPTATEILPFRQGIQYSDAERNFLRIWLGLAIAWFVWRERPIYHQILGFYLAALVIQIVTEQVVSSIGFPSLVVTIGTIYTLFRLWQIWQGYQLIHTVPGNSSMSNLLGLLGLFWFGNTIFLVTVGWPSIWSQN